MDRFKIIDADKLDESGLIGPDFEQLKDVGETKDKVVVDTELKHYWFSSDSAVKITAATIQLKYNQSPDMV